MDTIEVKIVKLPPMRVVSAYGFGAEPENEAWEKMAAFMDRLELPADARKTTFGFNNPNPSAGSPNYGYEIWLPVDDDVAPSGDLRVVGFAGGLYATTTFTGLQHIGDVWKKMAGWVENSKYKRAHHQWLEELISGADLAPENFVFTIYLPISE